MNYIFSPCVFAAKGVAGILKYAHDDYQYGVIHDFSAGEITTCYNHIVPGDCAVFYYPDDPRCFINSLLGTIALLNHAAVAVVIFTSAEPGVIYDILSANVRGKQNTESIFVYNNKQNVNEFYSFTLGFVGHYTRSNLNTNAISIKRKKALKTHELLVLLDYFSSGKLKSYIRQGHSKATGYRTCRIALAKFIPISTVFEKVIPARRFTREDPVMNEKAFVAALQNDDIIPYFQPVTNENKEIKGFEILSRWRFRGELLSPQAFIPLLRVIRSGTILRFTYF